MSLAPKSSMEVERKYDVGAETPLPDWAAVPGLRVSEPEVRELDARYYDTADAFLARRGIAVRRRTGGNDAGWHIKGPRTPQGRLELQWPDSEQPPAALGEAIVQLLATLQSDAHELGELAFAPLARIRNRRIAYQLTTADGTPAEFVDDNVLGSDERTGSERRWREWELELHADVSTQAGELLFAQLEGAIAETGAVESVGSKLGRALGSQPLPFA